MAAAVACGDDDGEPARGEASHRAEGAGDPAEGASADPAEAPEAVTVRYDFAAHLARAEHREGEVLVVDFGAPRSHQFTLGGWQTQLGDDHSFDDVSTLVVPRVTGKVLLPRLGPGRFIVKLRARAFGDGRMTTYLGEETLGHATLPTDGSFQVVTLTLPEDALASAEAFLQMRVPRGGPARGVGSAGLAIDWLRIGPADADLRETAPATDRDLLSDGQSLSLAGGTSLAWSFEVTPGARFRAQVAGSGGSGGAGGTLRLRLATDGGAVREVASVVASSEGAAVDVDLAGHAGQIVRLELVAEGADLRISDPAVVTLGAEDFAPRPAAPRNVLVYLVDTLRRDKLTIYDPDTRVRTPGLSSFVSAGAAVFSRGHTQENWTKPSVATLLSGLLPWEHTATSDDAVVPGSVELLSETLKDAGFHTGAFIANGYVSDKFGFRQGWASFRNYIREGRRTQASFVAADVLGWLDDRPEDEPFFLYVHTIDPHVPYMPPNDVLETYDPGPYDGPVDFGRDRQTLEKIKSGAMRINARDRQRLEALYDGEITYHDVHFASIIEGLTRRGLAEDTLVVFTSDHGEEFFDHGSVGHGHSVYEELLSVPFVIRIPGLTAASSRIEDPAGLVDIAPTILDALGRPVPEAMTGRSLLPLLRGEVPDAPRAVISGFMNGWRTIVVGRYKLIQRTSARMMLYDLEADPGETTDLAADRPLAVRYLRGLLGLTLAGAAAGAPTHRAEETVIDAETEAQLRALGYVGTSRPE
ncbi:MAG: sulfatase [Deltaproteobacteria bacterium]|nr:sulfatase [Deltaproteobacteria bacterium]